MAASKNPPHLIYMAIQKLFVFSAVLRYCSPERVGTYRKMIQISIPLERNVKERNRNVTERNEKVSGRFKMYGRT